MSKRAKISLVLLIATALLIGIVYFFLPNEIPIHWNYRGEADRFASKNWLLLLAPLPSLIYYFQFSKKE